METYRFPGNGKKIILWDRSFIQEFMRPSFTYWNDFLLTTEWRWFTYLMYSMQSCTLFLKELSINSSLNDTRINGLPTAHYLFWHALICFSKLLWELSVMLLNVVSLWWAYIIGIEVELKSPPFYPKALLFWHSLWLFHSFLETHL